MSKLLKITGIALALVAVLALLGATTILAQELDLPTVNGLIQPGPVNQGQNQPGPGMHLMMVDQATMHAAIADALGISVAELEAELAAGKTVAQLAQELGVDFAVVRAAMDAVHAAALQQAVADGLITQEQADWMLSHRGGMNGNGNGYGNGNGGQGQGGGRHGGMGQHGGNSGDCPYMTP